MWCQKPYIVLRLVFAVQTSKYEKASLEKVVIFSHFVQWLIRVVCVIELWVLYPHYSGIFLFCLYRYFIDGSYRVMKPCAQKGFFAILLGLFESEPHSKGEVK